MPQRRSYQRRSGGNGDAPKHGDVYQQVNGRILASLNAGTVPWQRPWLPAVGRPVSLGTRKPFNGVNILLTGMTALERGYTSRYWGTVPQINALGGHVRAGESRQGGRGATYITIWRDRRPEEDEEERDETEGTKPRFFAAMKGVFNADQCDGLPPEFYPEPGAPVEEITEPEAALAAYEATPGAAEVLHDVHGQAYYDPDADQIHVPSRDGHTSAGRYYSTRFHEDVHSTGHKSRLDRAEVGHGHKFGSPGYGREELTAEMGTAYLCAATGIDTPEVTEQNAAYLQSWVTTINEDKRAVVRAASGASKAADLILEPFCQADPGTEPDSEPEPAHAADIEAA